MIRRALVVGLTTTTAGCALTPLTNKIAPGQDPFVVAIGEGSDGQTDLFAAQIAGGSFVRFTFTRAAEYLARLSPSGTEVAFLRDHTAGDSSALDLVVMNLLDTGERRIEIPEGLGRPSRLGWSADGSRIYLRGLTTMGTEAPPASLELSSSVDPAAADSSLAELLGDPPYAAVTQCGARLCLVTIDQDTTLLPEDTREAIRWSADSMALLRDETIEIRPLGGGRLRRPEFAGAPSGLRSLSHHAGTADRLR